MLGLGQTGSRAEIPWRDIGPGWALVTDTDAQAATDGSKAEVWVYLVDPDGGKYEIYRTKTTDQIRLMAWSGDTRRAIVFSSGASLQHYSQLDLASGRLAAIPLSAAKYSIVGYTRPAGTSLLVSRLTHARTELSRYTLTGHLERQLATIVGSYGGMSYSPNGQTIVAGTQKGIELVNNASGKVTRLPSADGCAGVWWNATTLLTAGCSSNRLDLVPVDGAHLRTLVVASPGTHAFLSGAWHLRSATYVQESGPAAGAYQLFRLVRSGLKPVLADDGAYRPEVIAASTTRLMVAQVAGGGFVTGLAVLDPATGMLRAILTPTLTETGVSSWVPYYVPVGQN